jgi:hypothetical protein
VPAGDTAAVLDRCARLHIDRRGRVGSYFVLGCAGFAAAAATAAIAGPRLLGASPAMVALLTVVSGATFLAGVKASQVVFGEERIVLYELVLLVGGAGAAALRAGGFSVAAGLDVLALGIGVFATFGRVGCFMVGCCHGRPARHGVRYGDAHADAGFPRRWVGRPLQPVQLAEAAFSLALAAGALAFVAARRSPAGTLAFICLTGYGLGRFALELLRGDSARPQWRGLSEAQLIAVVVAWALVALRAHSPAAWAAAGALTLAAALVAAHRRLRPSAALWLRSPWHLDELEALLARWRPRPGGAPLVATTRLGLRVSLQLLEAGASAGGGAPTLIRDLLLSFPRRALAPALVRAIADDLALARGAPGGLRVQAGLTEGLVHVLVPVIAGPISAAE